MRELTAHRAVGDGTQPTRQRLGEQVASLLLQAIRLHEYLPDERLPSEAELCEQLGVNRMAVREGLRWLEDHKYVRMQRGRYGGALVLDPGLDLAVDRLRGRAEDLRQLFEFRAAVEPLVAALAAERIEPVELAMLDRLHEEELAWPSVPRGRFRAIDVAIHKAIAAACRNQYLIDAVRDIRVWLAPGLDLLDPSIDRRNESVESHGQLIACLHAGDSTGADAVMRAHIDVTARAVEAVLEAQTTSDAAAAPRPARSTGKAARRGVKAKAKAGPLTRA
ncbi:MAG TPA: FCD domain-containing protein [Acidimicrobiales bacterium]|nr:FCD domain-containing protein [Acidimicrobiales bacterium]